MGHERGVSGCWQEWNWNSDCSFGMSDNRPGLEQCASARGMSFHEGKPGTIECLTLHKTEQKPPTLILIPIRRFNGASDQCSKFPPTLEHVNSRSMHIGGPESSKVQVMEAFIRRRTRDKLHVRWIACSKRSVSSVDGFHAQTTEDEYYWRKSMYSGCNITVGELMATVRVSSSWC